MDDRLPSSIVSTANEVLLLCVRSDCNSAPAVDGRVWPELDKGAANAESRVASAEDLLKVSAGFADCGRAPSTCNG